ncbi:hypothetical protein niasHT_039177 [Heterodera trifolii]|uniref:Uncharacterized protein n=1 Tax=Heterodera trifolii TaxID=157864 RepID=A0ABD2I4G4_9BILA
MSDDQRSELLNIMAAIAFCNQMSMDAFLLTVRLCDVFMTKTTQEMTKTKAKGTQIKGHENRTEDKPTLVLAKYYLETAMFSLELCQLKIEKIAAACLMAATMKLEEGRNYVESYATHTGYGFA